MKTPLVIEKINVSQIYSNNFYKMLRKQAFLAAILKKALDPT